MKKAVLFSFLLTMCMVSCSDSEGNVPVITITCSGDSCRLEATIIIDDNLDEWGNCSVSPYTKFYEEWEKKEGWTDGMERVYDAWITLDKEYFVQTIKSDDALNHKYSVCNHKVKDRATFNKYFNREQGWGGLKGVIYNE